MREHGSIAGNAQRESSVTLTNRHRFSYPGYAELLLGEAHDDVVASNDPIRNPYVTLLEELKRALALPTAGVAVFADVYTFRFAMATCELRVRVCCTSRSARRTTGPTMGVTTAFWTHTRAPTRISTSCGLGCRQTKSIAAAHTSS